MLQEQYKPRTNRRKAKWIYDRVVAFQATLDIDRLPTKEVVSVIVIAWLAWRSDVQRF
jgi:hypothetical protein